MIRNLRRGLTFLAALAGLGGAVLQPQAAMAADLVVGVYASDPGVCGEARVLKRINHRFHYQVRHVPNLPQVTILDFNRIGETRFEPAHKKSPIERRYCHAKVVLSGGYERSVWYLIENPMGFASIGSNVEFCVEGFDPWRVYNSHCRDLR
ncbi:MAG: hypothetical protein AB7F96_22760 [Beijerinckiaceae bacterium]